MSNFKRRKGILVFSTLFFMFSGNSILGENLFDAVRTNDIMALVSYFDNNPDVDIDERDILGRTPLFWAVSFGNEESVAFLIDKGADIQALHGGANSYLHYVAEDTKKAHLIKWLLPNIPIEHLNRANRVDQTPLSLAVNSDNDKVIQALLRAGVNPLFALDESHDSVLLHAVRKENSQLVLDLINSVDLDPLLSRFLDIVDATGRSALSMAIEQENSALAALLLLVGANINVGSINGHSNFFYAIHRHNLPIISLLIDHSSNTLDINQYENDPVFGSMTALDWALEDANTALYAYLVSEGALSFSDLEHRNIIHPEIISIPKATPTPTPTPTPILMVIPELEVEIPSPEPEEDTPISEAEVSDVEVTPNPEVTPTPENDINALDETGLSALHRAVFSSNMVELDSLLANPNLDPNILSGTADGIAPLHMAVVLGVYQEPQFDESSVSIMKKLLSFNGIDPNIQSSEGVTPLHLAVSVGNYPAITILIDAGADKDATFHGATPLVMAVTAESFPSVEALVEAGANVNEALSGTTLLHMAASMGNVNIGAYLVFMGADLNAKDAGSLTPGDVALEEGFTSYRDDVEKLVLTMKTSPSESTPTPEVETSDAEVTPNPEVTPTPENDINALDVTGLSALHRVAMSGDLTELDSLLIHPDLNPNVLSAEGMSPLHQVAIGAAERLYIKYIEEGASSSTPQNAVPFFELPIATVREILSTDEAVPIFESSAIMAEKILSLEETNLNIYSFGITPLHLAAMMGNYPLIRVLVDAGANINAIDHDSDLTPLHLAASMGHVYVGAYLVFMGADLNAKDAESQTPGDVALLEGFTSYRDDVEKLVLTMKTSP